MALRSAAKLASLGGASAALGVGAYAQHDEGTSRSLTFWYHCLPVYASYRAVQFRHRDAAALGIPPWTRIPLDDAAAHAAYERLHDLHAEPVRDLVLRMRGFYFKNAQLLSTRDDFVPSQYLAWCKQTQGEAPTEMAPGEARAVAERALAALGHPDAIAEWDDERPLGVASIGTVHRARLSDAYGGKEVAVKVQAPGIERKFRADIRTCIDFCKLAMPQHAPPLEEIERQFLTEFDYRAEAENLREIRDALGLDDRGEETRARDDRFFRRGTKSKSSSWRRKIAVPEPYLDLCSREVLVMELLPGVKLVDGFRARLRDIARARGTTAEALEAAQTAKIADGKLPPRDVAQETAATARANALIAMDDLLRRRPLWALGRAFGRRTREKYLNDAGGERSSRRFAPSPRLINVGALLRTLLDVHAEEIFERGVFNGDPHPGNVLLMPDGRLGLIDYGQVKRIDAATRLAYAKLILAIVDDDTAEVARLCQSDPPEGFGGRSKRADADVAYKLAVFWNDRDTPDVTEGMNLQEFIDEMERRDPVVRAPEDMVMIARVSMLLRGTANAFNVRLSVAEAWEPSAARVVEREDPEYLRARGR